jgi:hypothetical protein
MAITKGFGFACDPVGAATEDNGVTSRHRSAKVGRYSLSEERIISGDARGHIFLAGLGRAKGLEDPLSNRGRRLYPGPSPLRLVLEGDHEVGRGEDPEALFGPLNEDEVILKKIISDTDPFQFLRVPETVKIKVKDGRLFEGVGLYEREGRALDGALVSQGLEEAPDECGLPGPKVSVQEDQEPAPECAADAGP